MHFHLFHVFSIPRFIILKQYKLLQLCVWLNFTFVGVGAEAWQTGQQHRYGVLRPAV